MQALPSLVLLLTSHWARGLVGATIISALIWSFLPAVPAFARPLPRVLAILAVFAVFGAATAFISWRARKRAGAVDEAIAAESAEGTIAPAKPGAQEAAAEVAALRLRLREALAALRKRGVRRPYELPWYVIIGPPGSGKTTALRQSGLHFPLDAGAADPLQGVGGTRLCDWWFSEEAVLIDTAGRYTTQDSRREVDRAGWFGFLDLLRRTRPRQPINGAIVVISLSELLEASDAQRVAHARAIRQRIDELSERLRVRVPVYLVISKMDRLAGFDAFFEDLDSVGRSQVWGVTFGLDEDHSCFDAAFRNLRAVIDERLIDRLQAERGFDRRAQLSGFPLQLASIGPILTGLLESGFSGSRIDPAPFLRGVYLTSATQNGTPFDRLSGMLARSFDIDQRQAPPLRPAAARGYFLSRLTREVILGETPLVAIKPGRFRRRKLIRASALGAVAVATVLGLAALWGAEYTARAAITRKQTEFADYRRAVAALPNGGIGDDHDLEQVAGLLDRAADLPTTGPQTLASLVGLSTRPDLVAAGRAAYAQALQHLLYPRLVWRIEQQMRADLQDPEALYDATRAYLLLGGVGPHEPDVIRSWITADWARRFPGALNEKLRADLARHLDALLADPPRPGELPLDGVLVTQARAGFGHVTPAARIYDRIRALADAREAHGTAGQASAWIPADAVGAAAATFVRGDGQPLSVGVAGFLTGAGFTTVMRRDLPPAARAVADESWVLGRDPGIATDGTDVGALEAQVAELWSEEATARWSSLLADLDLRPFGGGPQTENALYLLSSPQSPLRDMLLSIARAIVISGVAPDAPGAPVAASWNARWSPLLALVGIETGTASGRPAPAAGATMPIDGILRLVASLESELATGHSTPGTLPMVAQATADPAQLIRAEASRQPHPLSQWLQQIAESGSSTLGAEARSAASGAFHAPGGPQDACHALVDDHYPFDPESADDASIADFARVFAPGGALDAYFQANVAPYVDTTGTSWRLHPAGGVAPPFTMAQLAPFQRAAAIRRAFFPAGGTPALYLTLNLAAPGGTVLRLGGATVSPGVPASLSWPGSDGLSPAKLQSANGTHDETVLLTEQGPWAFFRLLGDATRERGDDATDGLRGDHFHLSRATMAATLVVDAGSTTPGSGSVPDPFDRDLLAGFACPRVP